MRAAAHEVNYFYFVAFGKKGRIPFGSPDYFTIHLYGKAFRFQAEKVYKAEDGQTICYRGFISIYNDGQ